MSELARRLAQNAKERVAWEDSVRASDKPVEGVSPLSASPWSLGRKLLESIYSNPESAAELGLSMAPGSGEAMSARDAWDASGRGVEALRKGEYGNAASEYGNLATALLGAIPGAGIVARGTKRGAAWMDRNLPTGVNKLVEAMSPQASQDTLYAIPAWHGSPHDFDQFKLDKIGTGEGAQAYGHGLYFAENQGVADSYRRALAGKGMPLREIVERHLGPDLPVTQGDLAAFYSAAAHGDKDALKAANAVQMRLAHLRDEGSSFTGPAGEKRQKIAAAIENIRDIDRGRLYRTELDVEPEDLLDYDIPLKDQSPKVVEKLKGLWGEKTFDLMKDNRGSMVIPRTPEDVARLREAGIPGIRYLDQGSRGAGEGSRNFVIFDDSLVKILGKE